MKSHAFPRDRLWLWLFKKIREMGLPKFQALSRSEQDIFLMAQLKAMNGRKITASRRLKKKTRTNKRTFYYWDRNTPLCQKTYLNMLGIGRIHFENVRNHLTTNGIIPRIHGNVKKYRDGNQNNYWYNRRYRREENYAEIHGLPSPLVETSIALPNRLYFYQQKQAINRSIETFLQVLKKTAC